MKNFDFKKAGLIAPVYYLSIFSAVSIPLNSSILTFFRLYASTILIAFTSNLFGVEIWETINQYNAYIVLSTNIMYYLNIALLILLNIFSILMPCFIYSKNYSDLLKLYFEIDTCLQSKPTPKDKIHIIQYVKFSVVYGSFLLALLSELYKFGTIAFLEYFIEDLQTHHFIIEMFVMDNLLVSIKQRFVKLNRNLQEICDNRTGNAKTTMAKYFKIRNLLKAYELLINQVDYFNTVFGWQIFLFVFLNIASILLTLDLMIKNSTVTPSENTNNRDIMFYGVRSLLLLIFVVTTAANCDGICTEAHVISQECQNYLVHLPPFMKDEEQLLLKEQVEFFMSFNNRVFPNFSAGGCFNINLATLITFSTIVTSFIIVSLQF